MSLSVQATTAVVAFALVQFFVVNNGLEYLSQSEVAERTSTLCIVAGVSFGNRHVPADVLRLLTSLEQTFKLEERVSVVVVNYLHQLPVRYVDSDSNTVEVYPRIKVDRACLLAPYIPVSRPLSYTGPLLIDMVTQFVNEHCGTYRLPSGQLTAAGLIRRSLLDNVFNVSGSSQRCERIELPSQGDFFSYYLAQSKPVVIAGGVKHWVAMTKWTKEYLYHEFGHNNIHVKLAPNGEFEGCDRAADWDDYRHFQIPEIVKQKLHFPDLVVVRPATLDMSFSSFLDMITGSEMKKRNVSAYLEYSSIPQYMPKLEKDIEELLFVKGILTRRQLNLWLSDGNTLGKLHFDPFDNLLCQISGTKHVTLFEPHDNTRLYESHIPEALLGFDQQTQQFRRKMLMDSTSMVMSPVDITKPDKERFPLFMNISPIHCTIHPGDVLYMPAFWWHEVRSTPDLQEARNMAVNYWYEPFFTKEFPCAECKLDVNEHYSHLLHYHL